jgi:ubiquinone/menaquinone biosynthesis C-methylase UbiE
MDDYEPVMSFGEDVARHYDDDPRGDESAAEAFLAQLAGEGPALELAIGTGRIALPLAARGIRVDGIDLSPPMVGSESSVLSPTASQQHLHERFVRSVETPGRVGPTL